MKKSINLLLMIMWIPILFSCKRDASKGGGEGGSFKENKEWQQDRDLLDRLQKETFQYMWNESHPVSGLVYERNTGKGTPVTTGGSGFGIAAIVVATERGWINREEAVGRLLKISAFLRDKTERKKLHGAFPHWLNGETGKTIAFSPKDNGADIVETSFLMEGLLIAKAYFNGSGKEENLRHTITTLWEEVEWNWFARGQNDGIYWHWSPEYGFEMNMKVQGFNECMVTYVLAAASPTYPINRETYNYWTSGEGYRDRNYNGYPIQASMPYTGPLFFVHYSFIGLDPMQMADQFVTKGYGVRNITQTLINRAYCLENAPKENMYSPLYWGLTASDIRGGYTASAPDNDHATVAPTAALSSMPYTPQYSMQVLWNIYNNYRKKMWGPYGPYDAFSLRENWFATSYLSIDQLPIACMVENYRSGLLWKLFMGDKDVQKGLKVAGIHQPDYKTGFPQVVVTLIPAHGKYMEDAYDIRRHPDTGLYAIPYYIESEGKVDFTITNKDGVVVHQSMLTAHAGTNDLTFPQFVSPTQDVFKLEMKTGANTYELPIRMH